MPSPFSDEVVAAVLRHMNGDHQDDNLLIARAFGGADIVSASMRGFDGDAGEWTVSRTSGAPETLRVPWPGGPIQERPEVRREVVALYDAACAALGVDARPHG
ncbi:DUF2470 domain-containing protein [Microbacterium resistens]|uniref:DUF2470 domain-containing protein n=1 Tax=Microbacterium resistens TaxID=156977 RepID=UPI00082E78F8|nr:DUF2470 domain-containing protein [Microbacterium resistens]